MKRIQTVFHGILATVFVIGFTACPTDTDTDMDVPVNISDITWAASIQNSGWINVGAIHGGGDRSETRSITFTFSRDPGALTASDIKIASISGSATIGSLSGHGINRTLMLSGVIAGTVLVSIDRDGIEGGARTMTLSGRPPDITWTATPIGSPYTTAISFTFSANIPAQHLGAHHFTITPGSGSATKGSLSGSGTTLTLAVSNVDAGTVSVSINITGIVSEPQAVTIVIPPPEVVLVPGDTLAERLSWIRGFGQSWNHYIVEINGNEDITVANAGLPSGRINLTVTLRGIVPSDISGTFTVPSGVTLTLGENITITGSGRGVTVNNGGILIMNAGARIAGNTLSTTTLAPGGASGADAISQGGGVFVGNGGRFIMNGGEISSNFSVVTITSNFATSQGGGVFVAGGGVFNMNNGVISGNRATATRNGIGGIGQARAEGGGVSVIRGGTFTMKGGEISGNQAIATRADGASSIHQGGGVFVDGPTSSTIPAGIFHMSNGIIRGNETAVAEAHRNTSGDGLSASLFNNAGTAQRGTFSGDIFSPLGDLGTTNITVNVENGVLAW